MNVGQYQVATNWDLAGNLRFDSAVYSCGCNYFYS